MRALGRIFALTQKDEEASNGVVKGKISISSSLAKCLFDSGSTHSFVSPCFAQKLYVAPTYMDVILSIATPLGVSLDADLVYGDCVVQVEGKGLPADLILLDMNDFNVILGMDWLSAYHATVGCFHKRVTFSPMGWLHFRLMVGTVGVRIIYALRARRLLSKGCTGYLVSIIGKERQTKTRRHSHSL